MVSPDAEIRNAAEKGLQELIERATNMATKTHTSEEELKADLANLKASATLQILPLKPSQILLFYGSTDLVLCA